MSKQTRFVWRSVLSIALLALLLSRVNWRGLGSVLSHLDPGKALVASLLTPLLVPVLALRWRLFLLQHSIFIRFRVLLSLTWAGEFFNSVLPGSTGGDVIKIVHLCRLVPQQKAAAATSVILDRLSALLALLALGAWAFFTGPTYNTMRYHFSFEKVRLVVLGGAAALVVLLLILYFLGKSPHWMNRFQHLLSVLKAGMRPNPTMLMALVLAFAAHLLNFAIFFGFARALGLAVSYPQVLSFMPLVLTLALLPITVSGHGLREALLFFYFTEMNISLTGNGIGIAETVVSLSLVTVGNGLLWTIPGGLLYLLKLRLSKDPEEATVREKVAGS